MGNNATKGQANIAVATVVAHQHQVAEFQEKMDKYWYLMIILTVVAMVLLLTIINYWCIHRIKSWLRMELRMEPWHQPIPCPTTRKYNTKKADWSCFDGTVRTLLARTGLTSEAIGSVEDRGGMEATPPPERTGRLELLWGAERGAQKVGYRMMIHHSPGQRLILNKKR
ncbi:hypothetical protein ACJJTC_011529 [Scirpophaga incertulas]